MGERMSIYPVRLSEWFPPADDYHQITFEIVKYTRCESCGKKLRWKSAIGHHSIPWGYGDIWCSKKCLNSDRIAKPDKRRQRRLNRQFRDVDKWVELLDNGVKE